MSKFASVFFISFILLVFFHGGCGEVITKKETYQIPTKKADTILESVIKVIVTKAADWVQHFLVKPTETTSTNVVNDNANAV